MLFPSLILAFMDTSWDFCYGFASTPKVVCSWIQISSLFFGNLSCVLSFLYSKLKTTKKVKSELYCMSSMLSLGLLVISVLFCGRIIYPQCLTISVQMWLWMGILSIWGYGTLQVIWSLYTVSLYNAYSCLRSWVSSNFSALTDYMCLVLRSGGLQQVEATKLQRCRHICVGFLSN